MLDLTNGEQARQGPRLLCPWQPLPEGPKKRKRKTRQQIASSLQQLKLSLHLIVALMCLLFRISLPLDPTNIC